VNQVRKLLILLTVFALAVSGISFAGGQQARPRANTLRVGMDLRYPPFETQDNTGVPFGISVDVAKAFGEYLGRPVEIVDTNFASLIPALNAGEIDIIIASMSRTPERAQSIDFSDTYFYFKIISLVNRQFAERNNITIDTPKEELTSIDTRFTGITGQVSASIPQQLGFDVEIATNLEAAVLNVVQGSSDVLMMSAFPVTRGHLANPEDTIVLWDPFVSSPIAMGVRQGESELLAQANSFIATMSQPGGLYDQLQTSWDDEIRRLLGRYGLEFFINEN
jgi:polar amino acid transport system substrate-binding protein